MGINSRSSHRPMRICLGQRALAISRRSWQHLPGDTSPYSASPDKSWGRSQLPAIHSGKPCCEWCRQAPSRIQDHHFARHQTVQMHDLKTIHWQAQKNFARHIPGMDHGLDSIVYLEKRIQIFEILRLMTFGQNQTGMHRNGHVSPTRSTGSRLWPAKSRFHFKLLDQKIDYADFPGILFPPTHQMNSHEQCCLVLKCRISLSPSTGLASTAPSGSGAPTAVQAPR